MRVDDWQTVLARELAAAAAKPFAWGSHDCCLFACGVCKALCGKDPAESLRGTYSDAAGAEAVIAAHGGDLAALGREFAARYGLAEVPPAQARRGDLGLAEAGGMRGLAVVDLSGQAAAIASESGFRRIPRRYWRTAWRVA